MSNAITKIDGTYLVHKVELHSRYPLTWTVYTMSARIPDPVERKKVGEIEATGEGFCFIAYFMGHPDEDPYPIGQYDRLPDAVAGILRMADWTPA